MVDYPIGHYTKDGWNLAFVFVNHYLGEGGGFFNDDWTPSINNDKGLAVLERMAKLATLMDPGIPGIRYDLRHQADATGQDRDGKPLGKSRAGAVNDPAESSVVRTRSSWPPACAGPSGLHPRSGGMAGPIAKNIQR